MRRSARRSIAIIEKQVEARANEMLEMPVATFNKIAKSDDCTTLDALAVDYILCCHELMKSASK